MTTLYKPVLIESAEQAEALPDGTIATRDRAWPRILLRDETGHHWASGGMAGFMYTVDMTGWTALVPIEAEEQHVAPDAITYSRYVTAWEEA